MGDFASWEESCVPSYCHSNPLAALLSWSRLFAAIEMAEELVPAAQRVLDFGASVGELAHLLPESVRSYSFVEQDDTAAAYLLHQIPGAKRVSLDNSGESYDWIFAVDSLEHNTDYEGLLNALAGRLSVRGVLIISGPTENRLYRLGRRIAGFSGAYHCTSIYEIEAAARHNLDRVATRSLFRIAPFFRISAWWLS